MPPVLGPCPSLGLCTLLLSSRVWVSTSPAPHMRLCTRGSRMRLEGLWMQNWRLQWRSRSWGSSCVDAGEWADLPLLGPSAFASSLPSWAGWGGILCLPVTSGPPAGILGEQSGLHLKPPAARAGFASVSPSGPTHTCLCTWGATPPKGRAVSQVGDSAPQSSRNTRGPDHTGLWPWVPDNLRNSDNVVTDTSAYNLPGECL